MCQTLIMRELLGISRVIKGLRQNHGSIVLREQRGTLAPIGTVEGSVGVETSTPHAGDGHDTVLGEASIPSLLADVVVHPRRIEGDDTAVCQLDFQVVRRIEDQLARNGFRIALAVLGPVTGEVFVRSRAVFVFGIQHKADIFAYWPRDPATHEPASVAIHICAEVTFEGIARITSHVVDRTTKR